MTWLASWLTEKEGTDMNLPNRLTMLRIFLVPVCVFFLLMQDIPHAYLWAMLVFIGASVTDLLDGKIARKRNLITNFGKLLDPLADKVLVTAVLLCFIELDLTGSLVVILIIAREFLVTSLRLLALESAQVIAANKWGKAKTVTQITAIIVVMFMQELCYIWPVIGEVVPVVMIGELFLWVAAVMTVISGVIYLKDNIHCIDQR